MLKFNREQIVEGKFYLVLLENGSIFLCSVIKSGYTPLGYTDSLGFRVPQRQILNMEMVVAWCEVEVGEDVWQPFNL